MNRESNAAPSERTTTPSMVYRWPLTMVLGALTVALAAQFAVPLPMTPVPMSLQALAVILVGGMIGAAAGTGALVLYLVAGAFGAPVFAGGAGGIQHLLGPSGGYLLAFPVAAAVAGRVAERGRLGRSLLASLLGMVTIHAGGLAQLTLLGGSFKAALTAGTVPFLGVDALKVVIGGLVLWRGQGAFRPRA